LEENDEYSESPPNEVTPGRAARPEPRSHTQARSGEQDATEGKPERPAPRSRSQARTSEAEATEGKPERPEPRPIDPRRRLRELLAIPERDRSDAQWDEINELEIQLAPGNRLPGAPPLGSVGAVGGAQKKFRGKPRTATPDQQQRRSPARPRKTSPPQS